MVCTFSISEAGCPHKATLSMAETETTKTQCVPGQYQMEMSLINASLMIEVCSRPPPPTPSDLHSVISIITNVISLPAVFRIKSFFLSFILSSLLSFKAKTSKNAALLFKYYLLFISKGGVGGGDLISSLLSTQKVSVTMGTASVRQAAPLCGEGTAVFTFGSKQPH